MKLTWLGHGGWKLEAEEAVILIDPWLDGNPAFPADRREEALSGATHVLLTHGHDDHTAGVPEMAREKGLPVFTMVELASRLEGVEATGFNKGGTVDLGGVKATMVPASHSTSYQGSGAGTEVGYVLKGDGKCVYFSGDTGIMADMEWIGAYFEPDVGILSCGGFYTMDMEQAAWAARRFFDFEMVLPSHYRTFPALAQDAEALKAGLKGVDVVEPEVLVPIEL
ncbi:metal-dependent hydrolase [Vannielia litorea]|uniref:L-ascorbate metabolism protein UlaG, beta-lactamase superfamily n=1 Tax=Vannielia litorea TaxID=1217970 RepID=A0A1N6EFM6_9RHOB|nr:metal-dependent hydrolase [Vannielia litorea]SIN81823.1 L-ascorbate metabolism protein UlaG, beta-lactamase superfamily [Vannielia litorea]